MSFKKRVVFDGVLGTFFILFFQGVCGQVVVPDVLGRDTQKFGMRHAKEFVDVGGISGADFHGSVDIGIPVRITVGEDIYRQITGF